MDPQIIQPDPITIISKPIRTLLIVEDNAGIPGLSVFATYDQLEKDDVVHKSGLITQLQVSKEFAGMLEQGLIAAQMQVDALLPVV